MLLAQPFQYTIPVKVDKNKNAVIIGAGPAGLTAAYELLNSSGIHPLLFEESRHFGGISRTIDYKGNRMDIGGHRFFSKSDTVMKWWQGIMPLQDAPAKDEILLNGNNEARQDCVSNPERHENVMLVRRRISRIFFLRKFFYYPIALKLNTFANMGLRHTLCSVLDYLSAQIKKRPNDTLENFYINRFGKHLYSLFFEEYTKKVWGVHPSQLGADWGAQRVKGVSLFALLKDALAKPFCRNGVKQGRVETSLIERFIYPKYGPGQLWEAVADDVIERGAYVRLGHKVTKVNLLRNRVVSVDITDDDGNCSNVPCDYLLSSMPLKELVASLSGIEVPDDVRHIADRLPYRDFMTVGLLLSRMKIKNETKLRTYANRIPDTWIYVQEREVKVGRIQIFNNWSPYMVKDYENSMFIGLEYFCNEGDELWQMGDKEFIDMAVEELVKMDMIERDAVMDATRVKVRKAYPAYYGSYYQLDKVRNFLDGIENLYCIGRNGQHRYNNMDHSMLTAMAAVDSIVKGNKDRSAVWGVNTEQEYHEGDK